MITSTRSNARLVRFGLFALILIACGYILTRGSSFQPQPLPSQGAANRNPAANQQAPPAQPAQPAAPPAQQQKIKATFVTLARNSDLYTLSDSIRMIEDRFNKKFHYDWVFLNDDEFSEEFKEATTALVSGTTKYGLIPKEHWSYPEWIDQEKAALVREDMRERKIIYGHSESYRHMCRFESGFFWRQDILKDYEYYWRVEPDIKLYCDIDYDVFKWMKQNNKDYGFTISLPEYKETIPTLWQTVKEFTEKNPQYLAKNNMLEWLSNDGGNTYNGCHFWSNFEIGNLNFFRSEAYQKYFEHLDKAGGFFYERWGDAPVHSIAAALFLPKEKIHFFEDVGYYHVPFHNCPIDKDIRFERNCNCNPKEDFTWKAYSCTTKYYKVNQFKRQKGWEKFSG
ncbi:alpha-1,2-mannosyltransferase [Spathaspora passalidarum NRRL Y-27907]|uniref:Alpha-1,2-mannosyltransferase n=1 Tax=Spathaspora passalidarum (strain NRRL Y-27907 / 11-Y1) TaxID=619300 RepID=G3AR78_SPAPN|nr:alpha-1,2-mannosyltransferase [Spathaspora passalidarum NRRL Y-27907]EGW31253.1 alpha-1,2-mannosyltransferase [Spathaspora passalidarum NRRL Y-27907]